jgi:hypothetical protein
MIDGILRGHKESPVSICPLKGSKLINQVTGNNEVINLKTYTYTLNVTFGNKTAVYTVVYPNDVTYNTQYYSHDEHHD